MIPNQLRELIDALGKEHDTAGATAVALQVSLVVPRLVELWEATDDLFQNTETVELWRRVRKALAELEKDA